MTPVVALLVASVLACFALRRVVLLLAAIVPARPARRSAAQLPTVTLVVPARDEADGIDATLAALARLEYPSRRLFVVLVNDGSQDDTGRRLAEWAAGRRQAAVLDLAHPLGKSEALNAAIAAAPPTDLVAACDADVHPNPAYLRRIAPAFSDESVGAASGLITPSNAEATQMSRYAAVELWVHQLVTSAGKDRLNLNPPTQGASVYRRRALEDIGWFTSDVSGEDVRASVALARAGWRTRFVREAVAWTGVAERSPVYWHQHVRWSRNLLTARRTPVRAAPRGRVAARIERLMVVAGYSDRIALLGVLGFVAAGRLPLWVPGIYLGVVAAQVSAALAKAGVRAQAPLFALATILLFPVDVAASAVAAAAHVLRRPRAWHWPPRPARAATSSRTAAYPAARTL